MKKLKLDDIRVESYETSTVPATRGTVQANENTENCGEVTPCTCCASCVVTYCVSCYSDPFCC
jgi:hypothetical protein